MLRSRPEHPRRAAGRRAASRTGAATTLAAAVAGLAVLAGCGTATAGSREAATGSPASTGSPATVPSPSITQSPVVSTGAAAVPPPSGGGSTPAAAIVGRVRVPLVLPAGSMPVAGSITGVVTLGLNRCLFLRTDAGQEFALAGPLGARVRTLMAGRRHPMVPTPDGGPAAVSTPGTGGVRIQARGSVSGGASVCSTPFQFIASTGAVQDIAPGQ